VANHSRLSALPFQTAVTYHVKIHSSREDNRRQVMRVSRAKNTKKIIGCALILLAILTAFEIFRARKSAQITLAEERARLLEDNRVSFTKTNLTPHFSKAVQIRQNTSETRGFVRFRDSYYAATSGGLVQYSEDGAMIRHYTVTDGLPESDLTALAVFHDKLYIGTRTANLIEFDGGDFRQFRWTDRKAQAVTAFLNDGDRLLIGTFDGGLLEFDGAVFREIKADNRRISRINCLVKETEKLYVGTFDDGLWIYESAIWTHFTTANGLPSNRVVGIAVKDKNTLAATDFGLAILQQDKFHALRILPAVSSLLQFDKRIFLSRANGEIYTFDESLKEFTAEKNMTDARLTVVDEKLYLLGNRGVYTYDVNKFKQFAQAENDSLTDNFISALAIDRTGNLWAGTFRRGIDVFAENGKRLAHLETENIREINYLQAAEKTVSAATSQGLLNFKPDYSVASISKKDGLPSNSITHFSGDALATAKGLAFTENGKPRILSAVNNLPSNSVYTTLRIGKTLYAGTLGGLAQIDNKRVTRVWKDSNSKLTTNWVTSLFYANGRIFIGTYGGGIFELLPSGEVHSFEGETGKFAVNPNALASDGERLYAGTLEGAKILDLQTHEWKSVKSVLPAETVMSITTDEKSVYFGTTNGIARVEKNYFTEGENK
jgi:ligand-binding sensor domain-containing protein